MFSLPLQQKLLGGGKNLLLPLYREVPETPSEVLIGIAEKQVLY